MKNQTCCFTGHRKIPPEQYERIAGRLREEIVTLIHNGFLYSCTGGALGFDTMAALTVLSLKKEYPIKLILVLPCKDQTKGWRTEDVKRYNQIREEADQVTYTSERYHSGCMFKRNRFLVECSSVCICYLTKKSGGTAYTVDYARQKGLSIIHLNPSR